MSSSDANGLTIKQTFAFNTFKVEKPKGKTRVRAKLAPKRRQEADAVRKKRACLRCSLLRIKCSDDDICTTCEKLAFVVHIHEKRTLSFSACIRTWLIEVNIFGLFIPPDTIGSLVLKKGSMLASTPISLAFASKIKWDIGSLIDDIVHWFNDPLDSTTSKVGTLSSPSFLDLIEPFVEANTRTNFQCMIYAESLAYTQPTAPDRHFLSCSELRQIGAMAGQDILKFLDKRLKPESLKHCSFEDTQALFLMVVGTILAVGYTTPGDDTEITKGLLESSEQSRPAGFQPMQDFLIRILAHYIIYLGTLLKLPIESHTEQFILESAPKMWNKEGVFQWTSTSGDNVGIEDNFEDSGVSWVCENTNSIDMNSKPRDDLFSILHDVFPGNESPNAGFSTDWPVSSEDLCTSSVQVSDEINCLPQTDLEPYSFSSGEFHQPFPQQSQNLIDLPSMLPGPGLLTSTSFPQCQERAPLLHLEKDLSLHEGRHRELWNSSSDISNLRHEFDVAGSDAISHSCPRNQEPFHWYPEDKRSSSKAQALWRELQRGLAESKLGVCKTFDTWEPENEYRKRTSAFACIPARPRDRQRLMHLEENLDQRREISERKYRIPHLRCACVHSTFGASFNNLPDIPRSSISPPDSASLLKSHGIPQPGEETACNICGISSSDGGNCASCTRDWNEILESRGKKRDWRSGVVMLGHAMTVVRQFLLV